MSEVVNIRYANSHKKKQICLDEKSECLFCRDKILHPKVEAMLKYTMTQSYQAYQSSRKDRVTASKISSILNENAFKSDTQMLDEFVSGSAFKGNECTKWGEYCEPMALRKFCDVTHHDLIPHIDGKTLVMHPKYSYLAASPDGITYCGKMVEIKCPWSKPVGTKSITIPSHYKSQLHLQQHVCDMDETYFVTYAPKGYKCGKHLDATRDETINIVKFIRDKNWLLRNHPKIKLFLMNVEYAKLNKAKKNYDVYMTLLESI